MDLMSLGSRIRMNLKNLMICIDLLARFKRKYRRKRVGIRERIGRQMKEKKGKRENQMKEEKEKKNKISNRKLQQHYKYTHLLQQ